MNLTEQAKAAVELEKYFEQVNIAQMAGAVVCFNEKNKPNGIKVANFFTVGSVERFIAKQKKTK